MKYDNNFLKKLDNKNLKIINVRITSYNMDDAPNEIIEGKVINGSINIDGLSNIRRSCSLSLVAKNVQINDYYWCFNTRFKIEIGIDNIIDEKYPKIIWFSMGYYLITSFTTSSSPSGYNISISGKDKMCLLNGELGGSFDSSVVFDNEEFKDKDGTVTRNKIPIKTIIKNLVHFYGGEPYYKILINDVPDFGLELERYQGDKPFYLLGTSGSHQMQATIDENYQIIYPDLSEEPVALKDISPENLYYANELLNTGVRNNQKEKSYQIHKVERGESCGYKITDLIYPTDLIAAAGESITSILDKIKNFLGPYEYFYDLNGNFVFQKQQKFISNINYSEDSYNANDLSTLEIDNLIQNNKPFISYSFDNNNLITNLSNNPNHMNVKNDFSIWGKRKGIDSKDIPIHFRYAIDSKPLNTYVSIGLDKKINPNDQNSLTRARYLLETYPDKFQLMNNENLDMAEQRLILEHKEIEYSLGKYDWRELIYQMAKDFFAFNQIDEFRSWIEEPKLNSAWIINGKTGYENYYTDIEGFWRQIYKTEVEKVDIHSKLRDEQKYNLLGRENFYQINSFLYNFTGPYYDKAIDENGQEEKILLKNFYYGENNAIQEIDAEETIKMNYNLLQKLYASFADDYNNNISPIKKEIQYYYYKTDSQEDSYKKILKDELQEPNSSADLSKLYGKELFLYIDEQYLSQGTFQWPLKIKDNDGNYKDIEKIYNENNQEISFLDTDSNFLLLSWLYLISLSDSLFFIGYWDENFFPFLSNFGSQKNPYVEAFKGFNKSALRNPENLNFWFDLLDKEKSDISKFSIKNIGNRKKIVSDDAIKSIYYLYTPNILFDLGDYTVEQQEKYNSQNEISGYAPINIPDQIKEDFIISSQGKSAYSVLENLLYNYTYCAEQININAIPIYYLQPNTIVNIHDKNTFIDGNYIIQKLTYNLSSNSTMSMQCIKFIEEDKDREEYWQV